MRGLTSLQRAGQARQAQRDHSHAAPVSAVQAAAKQDRAGPLQVLSVTPAAGAKGVNGAAPIRVQFSAPLAASTPMPTLWPRGRISGRQLPGPRSRGSRPVLSLGPCGPSSRVPADHAYVTR